MKLTAAFRGGPFDGKMAEIAIPDDAACGNFYRVEGHRYFIPENNVNKAVLQMGGHKHLALSMLHESEEIVTHD